MIDAIEFAQTYVYHWPAQENVSKDYLLPLGLDINRGFAKVAVENLEVTKRRTHLEQRLARLKRWVQSAGKREVQASRRRELLRSAYNCRSKEFYQELSSAWKNKTWPSMRSDGSSRNAKRGSTPNWNHSASKNGKPMTSAMPSSANQEHYCKEQREALRALEDLKEQERTMYKLDNRKDQVMSVCKVALANLAMWVRDQYFPASYAPAVWKSLLPFFQLSGAIIHSAQIVQVGMRPCNDRALNRNLAILCERVSQASPHIPDGRRLSFTVGNVLHSCCAEEGQNTVTP